MVLEKKYLNSIYSFSLLRYYVPLTKYFTRGSFVLNLLKLAKRFLRRFLNVDNVRKGNGGAFKMHLEVPLSSYALRKFGLNRHSGEFKCHQYCSVMLQVSPLQKGMLLNMIKHELPLPKNVLC